MIEKKKRKKEEKVTKIVLYILLNQSWTEVTWLVTNYLLDSSQYEQGAWRRQIHQQTKTQLYQYPIRPYQHCKFGEDEIMSLLKTDKYEQETFTKSYARRFDSTHCLVRMWMPSDQRFYPKLRIMVQGHERQSGNVVFAPL